MGETRVDLLRLLEDLRDAYPGSVEETILTELVANALDSGATRVDLWADSAAGSLTAVDNGKGMSRQSLVRFHDLAVTGKRRGTSIGFAGVGVKLGLLISDEVVTETLTPRRKNALATSWRLKSRTRAPWRWIEPPGILEASGTAVRLYLSNSLSPLLEPGFLESGVLTHFEPLFDEAFDAILEPYHPEGVRFRVNGRPLARFAPQPDRVPVIVKVGRQRKPSGVGFLTRDPDRGHAEGGVAVSTLGKVIRRGWDWLGMPPGGRPDVSGLVEVPPLAEALTLNKGDFIRNGTRGAVYLAYRKAIQEAVRTQLEDWGVPDSRSDPTPGRTRSLERDLRSVLADLSDDYPLLSTLVDRISGGQRRLPLGDGPSLRGVATGSGTPEGSPNGENGEASAVPDPSEGEARGDQAAGAGEPVREPGREGSPPSLSGTPLPGGRKRKGPARFGLRIRLESRAGDPSLGRLVESTVWVNDAHPAYRRAVASRSEGYHVALSVALALAQLTVEPADVSSFVARFLARWGEAGKGR